MPDPLYGKYYTHNKMMEYRDLIRISVDSHPDYRGLHQCYQEVYPAIKAHVKDIIQSNSIFVWKCIGHTGYQIIHSPLPFLNLSEFKHQKISLEVYKFPRDLQEIHLIKKHESETFLNFLKIYSFDLNFINPARLLFLINNYICPEVLIEINKKIYKKPRPQISLEVLANIFKLYKEPIEF